MAADLRSALRWFFTVPAGSFDLLTVSSCRRHLRNCATCSSPRHQMLGFVTCHTALLNACLGVWIHAEVVWMAQGPAPLDEADPCLEARPVCDLGGLFSFQPVLPASTQQPQAETASYCNLWLLLTLAHEEAALTPRSQKPASLPHNRIQGQSIHH